MTTCLQYSMYGLAVVKLVMRIADVLFGDVNPSR